MAHVVIMPKQGQSVESCIVSEFKKKPGDPVVPGDILFGYETDKATFEEESTVEGTVLACFFQDGDEIPVLTPVMVIGQPGESFEEFAPSAQAVAAQENAPRAEEQLEVRTEEPVAVKYTDAAAVAGAPASPRARRVAAEKGVDLSRVPGSGPDGRILSRDVEAAALSQGRLTGLAKARLAEGGLASPGKGTGLAGTVRGADLMALESSEKADYEDVKMSHMRKLIARSMAESLRNSAQLTHMLGADARRIQALRAQAKKALEAGRIDVNITINDLVCYAVIKALQQFPRVNSHCLGDTLRIFGPVHLGLAVDTERGLMVPAVANADRMDIFALSRALKEAASECKRGSMNPDRLRSEAASFTVSNLGGYGVEWFTPVLNLPQSAILGVGTMVLRPRPEGDGYCFVHYLGLSLTYDHRALDGGEATRFLSQVAREIENLELEF